MDELKRIREWMYRNRERFTEETFIALRKFLLARTKALQTLNNSICKLCKQDYFPSHGRQVYCPKCQGRGSYHQKKYS